MQTFYENFRPSEFFPFFCGVLRQRNGLNQRTAGNRADTGQFLIDERADVVRQ